VIRGPATQAVNRRECVAATCVSVTSEDLKERKPRAVTAAGPKGNGGTDCPRGQYPGAAVNAPGRCPTYSSGLEANGRRPPDEKERGGRSGNGRWESGAETLRSRGQEEHCEGTNPRSAAGTPM